MSDPVRDPMTWAIFGWGVATLIAQYAGCA